MPQDSHDSKFFRFYDSDVPDTATAMYQAVWFAAERAGLSIGRMVAQIVLTDERVKAEYVKLTGRVP
jgi:hypothetical protein